MGRIRLHLMVIHFIGLVHSNSTAKTKLEILAFLYCRELVKNPIRCIMLNSTDDLRLSDERSGKTAYETSPRRMTVIVRDPSNLRYL